MAGTEPAQAFIVGAQRCGTTTVASTLAAHPQVAAAQPLWPEPKFFLAPGASADVDGYVQRHYPDVGPDARLRLEKSTSYFESDVACAEIAAAFPAAGIVVVLRDPVDRALSHYGFSRANGLENLPAEEALDPAAEARPWDRAAVSVSPYRYLSRGRYVDDLLRWDTAFGPDAVHVVILEELVAEPSRFADLEAALGLDPRVELAPEDRHNAGGPGPEVDDGFRARLAAWFAEANAALADRLGRPIERWTRG